jgi:hypothetical protein
MSTDRILATHVTVLYILPPFAGEQQYTGWLIIGTMLCVFAQEYLSGHTRF